MIEVLGTDEFAEWFRCLDDEDVRQVARVVDKLELLGVGLGFPHSSALEGARYALRELRPSQGRSSLRIVYAFDPVRQAVLLLGGDKRGDNKFYDRMIQKSEKLFEQYLIDQGSNHDNM